MEIINIPDSKVQSSVWVLENFSMQVIKLNSISTIKKLKRWD